MTATTATRKIAVGRLVEYHGSLTDFHGQVFCVVANVSGRYDLANVYPDGTKGRRAILWGARRESVTPLIARNYWRSLKG